MKRNSKKAYYKPTTEMVYVTECSNILAGSGEAKNFDPSLLDRTDEPDTM